MAAAARRSSSQCPRHLASCQKDVSRELPTKPRKTMLRESRQQYHLHLRHRHRRYHPKHLTSVPPCPQAGDFPPLTEAGTRKRPNKKAASQAKENTAFCALESRDALVAHGAATSCLVSFLWRRTKGMFESCNWPVADVVIPGIITRHCIMFPLGKRKLQGFHRRSSNWARYENLVR
ncbi:hypothetical protein MRX96_045485 [Rhipicephalus microplus]